MGESKQVKVDNWGIFFLQRLQTFFNKTYFCDLTLQFEDNVQLKVHRLVLNACTEYFQVLEQTCDLVNDCLIMPPDLQADVVVPIVNFMYSGILEFQTSTFDRLYATARLMNMTVLTKLLDAQKVPIAPISKSLNKRPIAPITWNLQGKKIAPKTMDPDLPEQLPGRKLPIWKRKSAPVPHITAPIEFSRGLLQTVSDPLSTKYFRSQHDEPPKPTRFDWPEDDGFDTAPFDEISYTSRPMSMPTREKSPKPSTSNFDEVKRSSVKRSGEPIYNESKKVNIQDVKEYTKEQKIRSDYNDYDDSETADNDLQTYEDDSDDDTQNAEETRSILKNDTTPPHNKRVRFSLEGKENSKTPLASGKETDIATIKASGDVTNHTKIITEVLKKFPQLVQKNKNIRLKILAKGQNSGMKSPGGTPVKIMQPVSKTSYMVHKPNDNKSSNDKKDQQWTCQKCSEINPLNFDTYHAYRSHLTEMHNEKTDSQMCNICGHVSRKQNMLMYHKYVKHNIEPPPIFQFPKCKDCPYIALSPSLLIKHQYNHTHQNLVCAECSTPFANKTDLIRHLHTTGHTGSNSTITTYDCTQCPKKFISYETLNQHIRNNHTKEDSKGKVQTKQNIITAEEIDAMDEEQNMIIEQEQQEEQPSVAKQSESKPKENKIKILSDIKVNKAMTTSHLLPVKQIAPITTEDKIEEIETQQLEHPSSEAESLSNVASGIAASLGLVNTIVVLDENNQFILPDGSQTSGTQQNFILPEDLQNIVSQHQVITNDSNSIITQAGLAKNSIGSTDELVMVLTDHDYSDAANNAVLTSDNSNIVVLYSHPVQGQDGQFISQQGNLMLNSSMGLVEVSNNFGVTNEVAIDDKTCDESIEMIQQEINSHLEEEVPKQTYENDKLNNQQENVSSEDIQVAIEDNPESPEKMDIDPSTLNSSLATTIIEVPVSQEPLPGIQTIGTTQKYMFIPTTQDNIHEIQKEIPKIQEDISEIQENKSEMQENVTEVQESISEMAEKLTEMRDISEIQENIPEMQKSIPEIQENISTTLESRIETPQDSEMQLMPNIQNRIESLPTEIQEHSSTAIPHEEEIQFDEAMEVEESVEMVQQEIDRQQLERDQLLNQNDTSVDVPPDNNAQKLNKIQLIEEVSNVAVTDSKLAKSNVQEHIKEECSIIIEEDESKEIEQPDINESDQQEETVENIEKELRQSSQENVEEFVEHMEVDSAKHTTKDNTKTIKNSNEEMMKSQSNQNNLDLGTEDITSPENFDFTEEQEIDSPKSANEEVEARDIENKEQIESISEIEETAEVDDSGINTEMQSETCAEMSQLSETESLPKSVDEVPDLPLDTNSPEMPEHQNEDTENLNPDAQLSVNSDDCVQKNNSELSKKPFRISLDDFHAEVETSDNLEDDETTANPEDEAIIDKKDNESEEIQVESKEENDETQQQQQTPVTNETSTKIITSNNKTNRIELSALTKSKISNLLDDWDDGDTDSQQSDSTKQHIAKKEVLDNSNSINTLINDWEDEED